VLYFQYQPKRKGKVVKFRLSHLVCILAVFVLLTACSSTQKTGGHGVMSVVAQNVVRIACSDALHDADFSSLNKQKVYLTFTGFIEPELEGYIEHKFRDKVEDAGGFIVSEQNADTEMEVVMHNAGIDRGSSRVPIVTRSERTEGAVDAEIICRDLESGTKLSRQRIRGEAKYQQTKVLGVSGSGTYYVKQTDKWVEVKNPIYYD
jgi:hypothetical protein